MTRLPSRFIERLDGWLYGGRLVEQMRRQMEAQECAQLLAEKYPPPPYEPPKCPHCGGELPDPEGAK